MKNILILLLASLHLTSFSQDSKKTVLDSMYAGIELKGLKKENVASLKSIKGVKYVWIEEAQYVSHDSWRILTDCLPHQTL